MPRPPQPRYRIYTRPRDYARIAGEALTGWSGDEAELSLLERDVESRLGVAHAICMPQNRVGVYMAVRALVRPGRKIILSPYTLSDVINMVLCAGAIPVFADVDPTTCNLDTATVEPLIDDETDAVMVTHLHGLVDEMQPLVELCKRRGLKLLEDSAQAFGARRDGTYAATFGDAGIFSFGMYKNVNAFFGGMVVTPHADVAETIRGFMAPLPRQPAARYLRKAAKGLATDLATYPPVFKSLTYRVFRYAYLNDVGFLNRQVTIELDPKRKHEVPPHFLVRMSPVQARTIRKALPQVDENNHRRIQAARIYEQGLAGIQGLRLPPFIEDGSHIYTYYPLQAPDREGLIRYMVEHGRDVAVQHLRNCAELDCFADVSRPCPNAAEAAARVILLPSYPRFPLDEVRRNVEIIQNYFAKG